MARLLLLRHGKSDQDAGTNDLERPLTARGRKAARAMGAFLAAADAVPDVAVTSPAVRARTTLELAVEAGGWTCPTRVADELYMQGDEPVLDLVRAEPATTRSLLLIGHEPTWSDIVRRLTGAELDYPTATVAAIELEGGWSSARERAGALALLLPARLLPDA